LLPAAQGCSVLIRLLRVLLESLWAALSMLVPKLQRKIVLCTWPDFDDTTRSFVMALRDADVELILLVHSKCIKPPTWLSEREVTVRYQKSLLGIFHYHSAKYIFFTHGLFGTLPISSRQLVVNLWHGMPIKRIGLLEVGRNQPVPRSHISIASSEYFRPIIAKAFGLDEACVIVAQHPRIDVMLESCRGNRIPELFDVSYKRLVVWMPTYRVSVKGDIRVDGAAETDIFAGGLNLGDLNDVLRRHSALCVLKPHPMAKVSVHESDLGDRFRIVDENWLLVNDLSLYEVLGAADCLITDLSSVYFDFRLSKKTTIFYWPDMAEYSEGRGFVAPVSELIEEQIFETIPHLTLALERFFAESCASDGRTIRDCGNEHVQARATSTLLELLGVRK